METVRIIFHAAFEGHWQLVIPDMTAHGDKSLR